MVLKWYQKWHQSLASTRSSIKSGINCATKSDTKSVKSIKSVNETDIKKCSKSGTKVVLKVEPKLVQMRYQN